MARITPIRISENDRKEHARLVRNARSKISRTLKNHGVDLTGEIELPSIDDFSTRQQFNQWKEQASSFTNRYNTRYQFVTNEYGVTTSKRTINEITRMRKKEQRLAEKEIERIQDKEVKKGGETFSTVKDRAIHFSMPDVTGVHVPKDFKFSEVRSQRRLNEVIEVGERRSREDYYDKRQWQMQLNFIKGLEDSFDSDADELIVRLAQLDPEEFYHMYLENEEFDFDDFFYEDGEFFQVDADKHVTKMMAILDDYEKGKFNSDLRGF